MNPNLQSLLYQLDNDTTNTNALKHTKGQSILEPLDWTGFQSFTHSYTESYPELKSNTEPPIATELKIKDRILMVNK